MVSTWLKGDIEIAIGKTRRAALGASFTNCHQFGMSTRIVIGRGAVARSCQYLARRAVNYQRPNWHLTQSGGAFRFSKCLFHECRRVAAHGIKVSVKRNIVKHTRCEVTPRALHSTHE